LFSLIFFSDTIRPRGPGGRDASAPHRRREPPAALQHEAFDSAVRITYMDLSPQHPGNDTPSRSMSIVLDAGVSYAESRRT